MRVLVSGESHGYGLNLILDRFPAGFTPDLDRINSVLQERRSGYGRGKRMSIEQDLLTVTGGLIDGVTYGAPISFTIKNGDSPLVKNRLKREIPRPGHCDLPLAQKYFLNDFSIPAEYNGGRTTAIWTALGEFCRQFLNIFNIDLLGVVSSIGKILDSNEIPAIPEARSHLKKSSLRVLDSAIELEMKKLLDETSTLGDSLGGTITVVADGVPAGIGGGFMPDTRLDSRLAAAFMGVPAIKGFEIGAGFAASEKYGSENDDQLFWKEGIERKTNNAGGIEGGTSNGERIVLHAAMKPLPSIKKSLQSIDPFEKETVTTPYVRADVSAVSAAAIVLEAVTAYVLCDLFLDKFSHDSLNEIIPAFNNYKEQIGVWPKEISI